MKNIPEVSTKVAEANRGRTHSEEFKTKISTTKRKKSKRFDWENTQMGISHISTSVVELMDIYPELRKSSLWRVTTGEQPQYKGWKVALCFIDANTDDPCQTPS